MNTTPPRVVGLGSGVAALEVAFLLEMRLLGLHPRPPPRLTYRHRPLARQPRPARLLRLTSPRADRAQRRRPARPALTPALACPPPARPRPGHAQLVGLGDRRGQQHDLRAPPRPRLVALGLVRDHASRLQVVEPALHAAAMRTHEPRPLRATAGNRAPAHHPRQPRHQLLQRTREPARPRRMPQPEQVALDRVHPRLQPIITRRPTATPPPRPAQQRAHDQPARLRRDRRARRPISTTTRPTRRGALQRHRQRPKTPTARHTRRPRADARGAAERADRSRKRGSAGARSPRPSGRGWRSVRQTATVRSGIYVSSSRSRSGFEAAAEDRARYPVFLVLRGPAGAALGSAEGRSAATDEVGAQTDVAAHSRRLAAATTRPGREWQAGPAPRPAGLWRGRFPISARRLPHIFPIWGASAPESPCKRCPPMSAHFRLQCRNFPALSGNVRR
jgi:hypothetical protein